MAVTAARLYIGAHTNALLIIFNLIRIHRYCTGNFVRFYKILVKCCILKHNNRYNN